MDDAAQNFVGLCVLGSSSGGNLSALVLGRGAQRTAWLIDLGMSPRRTRLLLARAGLGEVTIAGALLTHLDHDHLHHGWIGSLPDGWRVMLHERHARRGERMGLLTQRVTVFGEEFELSGGTCAPTVHVRPALADHDDLGSVAYRFVTRRGDIGYATDLGRPTAELVRHLRGVDVLAVESNYCPRLQRESPRPDFLKRRITGGAGHLSNQQSARFVQQVAPSDHVVLLHLSRECNRPDLALLEHQHRGVRVLVSTPDEPTSVVEVRRPKQDNVCIEPPIAATLWG